ncbi:MAG TPA: roadblock/LC7 domain-containing protein [Stenomitos sp.]
MGARKPPKKPEKKSLFASLFGGFGKKKEEPKKRPASGGGKKTAAGAPKKGASLAKKPKVQAPPPDEDFLTNDDPLAGIENDLLGAIDGDMFAGVDFAAPEPPVHQPMHAEHRVPPAQPAMQAPQPQQQAAAPAPGSSLFGPDGVDNALDSLFDSFELGGAPAAPAPAPAPQPIAPQPMMQAPQPMQAPAPQPQPMAPRPQPAAQQPPQQDGLVSIGKLLVDQNTLKRIIDNAEKRGTGLYTTTRIISNAKGADLDAILAQIDQCGGVAGSLIVGRDGLVIASTLPTNFDKELVGAIASSMQTNLDVQCKKMKLGTARQVILDTEGGVVLLISLEVGVLVVMSQSLMTLDLTGVLSVIAGIAEKV